MPFNVGLYQFRDEFEMQVRGDGVIMLTPDHPVSLRLSELFNTANWTAVESASTAVESDESEAEG